MIEERQKCSLLTEKILSAMREDGYSYCLTDRSLNYIYRSLNKYCEQYYSGYYSCKVGEEFLEKNKKRGLSTNRWSNYVNGIIRLNNALEGNFHWHYEKEPLKYAASCFDSIVAAYEEYLFETGKTKSDVRARVRSVARFLELAEDSGISDISALNVKILYKGFETATDKLHFRKSIGAFIRYAVKYKLISEDISAFIPPVTRHKTVPTVYSSEEVETILQAADKGKNAKRNFCITLIAARLGLRACDIANITFNDIHRDMKVIALQQKKTSEYLILPLLDEIEKAIDDYVENERPTSDLHYVFLSGQKFQIKNIQPPNIYTIVSRIIDNSGVDSSNKKRGPHALRSSLASQLLCEGNNYSVIQKVLGHTSSEAAKHYVKIEVSRLRSCALEVQGFSAKVKKLLKGAQL